MNYSNIDEQHIRRCIELAKQSLKNGDNPFGYVIACGDKVIVERMNGISRGDVTSHAA